MRKFFGVVAALLVALACLPASAQNSGPAFPRVRELMNDLSFSQIDPVLRELGFSTHLVEQNGSYILVAQRNGRTIFFQPYVCEQAPSGGTSICKGLWMLTASNMPATAAEVDFFNKNQRPTRATLHQSITQLDRYLIADHGVTRGTFAVNVEVFVSSIDVWLSVVSGNSNTVALADEEESHQTPAESARDLFNLLSVSEQSKTQN